MPSHRSLVSLVILCGCLVGGPQGLLRAHAILQEARPAKNESVEGPDVQVFLRFNSRIDGGRSKLSLVLPDESIRALDIERQGEPHILESKAKNLSRGSYILRWQVLAADGHITRGEYPFSVK